MNWGILLRPRRRLRRPNGERAVCALLAASALAPLPAAAQDADTATAEARAAILQPGSIVKTADMDFGVIARPQSAGTVVLSPVTSTCTTTGGLIRTGACQPPEFAIRKAGNGNGPNYVSNMNGGQITLSGPGGATMSVTNLTIHTPDLDIHPAGGGGPTDTMARYRFPSNGIGHFRIGGTLHVNAGQAPGVYQGQLVINVQFN